MKTEELSAWLAGVPKVEMHLHLEGAIPLDALWELIQKYDGEPSVLTFENLADRFQFRNFAQFIET